MIVSPYVYPEPTQAAWTRAFCSCKVCSLCTTGDRSPDKIERGEGLGVQAQTTSSLETLRRSFSDPF